MANARKKKRLVKSITLNMRAEQAEGAIEDALISTANPDFCFFRVGQDADGGIYVRHFHYGMSDFVNGSPGKLSKSQAAPGELVITGQAIDFLAFFYLWEKSRNTGFEDARLVLQGLVKLSDNELRQAYQARVREIGDGSSRLRFEPSD